MQIFKESQNSLRMVAIILVKFGNGTISYAPDKDYPKRAAGTK
jgi:hypothetical protein